MHLSVAQTARRVCSPPSSLLNIHIHLESYLSFLNEMTLERSWYLYCVHCNATTLMTGPCHHSIYNVPRCYKLYSFCTRYLVGVLFFSLGYRCSSILMVVVAVAMIIIMTWHWGWQGQAKSREDRQTRKRQPGKIKRNDMYFVAVYERLLTHIFSGSVRWGDDYGNKKPNHTS